MLKLFPHTLIPYLFTCTITLTLTTPSTSQNTLGTLQNTAEALNGYMLFSPRTSQTPRYTYLIDNCGAVINQWESEFPLFSTDYLMEDGSLYRSVVDNQSTLNIPGNTGRIEHLDWDGNLLWGATISETDFSFHHDYVVLDNGNIIILVARRRTAQEAIDNGRNPENIETDEFYEEMLWEITPVGTDHYEIVWQWNSWDHLIQDFDNTKANFGVVAEHPDLIDINFGPDFDEADWWHSNAISYHPERDQIIISNRNLDEFIIIDHSTTTEEAATDSGGNSNRGGRILYRFGNPQAYDQGTLEDQVLYAQHDVQFIPEGSPNAGKILIFNNGPDVGFTQIQIINPAFNTDTFTYAYDGGAYGPETFDFDYSDPENFFAAFLSGAQELPNGNILINNGPAGFIFEITPSGQTVWQYQSPVAVGGILEDGDDAANEQTRTFRALKYTTDYEGLEGRDLTPQGVIELNPAEDDCQILSTPESQLSSLALYPNPVSDLLFINGTSPIDSLTIYNALGQPLFTTSSASIDTSALPRGLYFMKAKYQGTLQTLRFIKK